MNKINLMYLLMASFLSCNKPESVIKMIHKNGRPQIEYIYLNGKKDPNNYNIKQYYSDGRIEMTGQVKDGKDEGKFIWYYPNGKNKSVETYSKGVPVDTTYCYYESGILKRKVNPRLENGNRKAIEFYETGEIKIIAFIKNEKLLDSTWNGFYKNGQIKERGIIKDGERQGIWIYYKNNGEIIDSIDLSGKKKSIFEFDVLK